MLERIAQLMANPNPQMQQGLDVIAGTTPRELLARAQIQGIQSETAEKNRKAEERAYISEILSQGELTPEVVRQVMRYDPEYGMELMDYMRKQEAQKGKQEFLSRYMRGASTEGRDPSALVTAGALYNDPVLMQLGNFEQQRIDNERKRKDDLEKEKRKNKDDLAKEERKAPTGEQGKAATFATRMGETEKILTPLEMKGVSTANQGERALDALPFGNYMTSDDYKQYKQAQQDWVRAKLRKESGAVIAEDEMEAEIKTYFPQPGDTSAVIEQKRKARDTAVSALEAEAKPGFKAPRYTPAIPEGILPEEWNAMTDEERALWQ